MTTLRNTVAGATPPGVHAPGARVYSLDTAGGGPSPRFEVFARAVGTGGMGVTTCNVDGAIGSYEGLDQGDDDVRDPRLHVFTLPRVIKEGLTKGRC